MPLLKDLYLADSVETLNQKAEVPAHHRKHNARMLMKTANTLFENADKLKDVDEEKSYQLFMKYLNLIQIIKQSSDYKNEPKYFSAMLSPRNFKTAVESAEKLGNSLHNRYNVRKTQQEEALAANFAKMRAKNPPKTPNNLITNGGTQFKQVIEPTVLYKLMKEKVTSFFILDARKAADFKSCKLKHPHMINVPEECLIPGTTANKLERSLTIEDKSQWRRRTTVDVLILMDWTSETIEESRYLVTLKEAMFKWDLQNEYKSQCHVLKGGIENFVLHYPLEVEHPDKARNPPVDYRNRNGSLGVKNALKQVADLEYPDLNAAFIATPSPQSSPSTERPVTPETSSSLYPSSNDLSDLNKAILSGAITLTKEPSPKPAAPLIPDRSKKPTAADNVREILSRDTQDIKLPEIDRSTKVKMLLNAPKQEMKDVLDVETELIDDSLKLEQRQLELERRWEVLRLRREKEAEEDMKREVVKEQELLLEEIQKHGAEKDRLDAENKELRKELQLVKEKLEQEEKRHQFESEQQAIRRKEAEHRRLKDEVDLKRRQRKEVEERRRKLQEADQKMRQVEREVAIKERQIVKLKDDSESSFGGGLNRSHSSPNIAKMLDDEEVAMPAVNRNVKPKTPAVWRESHSDLWQKKIARFRDFQPVEGTGRRCLTGLKNLGNTCYMNSILQCLTNYEMPAKYFLNRHTLQSDLNVTSKTQGNVAIEFAEVLRMLRMGQYNSIVPADFKSTIGRYKDSFRTYDQQDAHELLNNLMEWLHDDLNEVQGPDKLKLPEQKNEGVPEKQAAHRAWELEKKVDRSFVRETFYGQWRSVLTCPCGWESVKYEPFFELALQLPPGNGRCSLRQCIEGFLKPEEVTYKCPKCDRDRSCTKKFEIVRLPPLIIIQFVRFYNDGLSRKRQNFVDFELNDLNLGQYAVACNGNLNRHHHYRLHAVCNHMGSMEGGHYTAYCYSEGLRKWFKYDDHEVYDIEPREVKTPKAYILFYSAVNI